MVTITKILDFNINPNCESSIYGSENAVLDVKSCHATDIACIRLIFGIRGLHDDIH